MFKYISLTIYDFIVFIRISLAQPSYENMKTIMMAMKVEQRAQQKAKCTQTGWLGCESDNDLRVNEHTQPSPLACRHPLWVELCRQPALTIQMDRYILGKNHYIIFMREVQSLNYTRRVRITLSVLWVRYAWRKCWVCEVYW